MTWDGQLQGLFQRVDPLPDPPAHGPRICELEDEGDLDHALAYVNELRRLRPVRAKTPIPSEWRGFVFERDGWECIRCGTNERLTVDHIIPESLGGPMEEWNLQTLCVSCNSRKNTKVPDAWVFEAIRCAEEALYGCCYYGVDDGTV